MNAKPPSCQGCPLEKEGRGFVPSVGPGAGLIALVGEAPGATEAAQGVPFVGAAGVYLNRALSFLRATREDYLIGNTVHCQPPKDWLAGAPWEQAAIQHCHVHRHLNVYSYEPTVYVTMGVTATKAVLREVLRQDYGGKIEDWQGYVCGNDKPPYVIPTFHPAHLLRGKQSLLGAFLFAHRRAMEIASFGFKRDEVSIVVDPDPAWFEAWASQLTPDAWLAVDTETAIKDSSEDEAEEPVGEIIRINFSFHPDQGVTVPWDPRYFPTIRTLLSSPCVKVFWNERFDVPLLYRATFPVSGLIFDAMWAWHMLQSSVPRGLGFCSPFYSNLPPWKHLSTENLGYYAAMDAIQTLRCMFGIAKDLKGAGQWDAFLRHIVRFDAHVLHPMEEIGLHLDKDRLATLHTELESRTETLLAEIRKLVPESQLPVSGGWKTPQLGSFPLTVRKTVPCCTDCGAVDVTMKHKCKKENV